jgi:hypothetical protein
MTRLLPLLVLACTVEAPVAPDAWGERITGSADWDHLHTFTSSDPELARYARAVGKLAFGVQHCSGTLIADDVVLTADHCGRTPVSTGTAGTHTADVTFGLYGPVGTQQSDGEDHARRRLIQLGVPAATANSRSLDDLTTFQCTREDPWRQSEDLSFWRCEPNTIVFVFGGVLKFLDVYPGHLWGTMAAQTASPSWNDAVAHLSVNEICGTGDPDQILVSPGEVDDTHRDCGASPFGSRCMEAELNSRGGSSGGPLVDLDTFGVYGVLSRTGEQGTLGPFGLIPADECDRGARIFTKLDDEHETYTLEDLDGGGALAPGYAGWATRLGHTGPLSDYQGCTGYEAVGGIVGSTAPSGDVDALGFVCVPYEHPERLRLDRARHIGLGGLFTGAIDEGARLAKVLAEDASVHSGEQTLVMCPEGWYVSALQASVTSTTLGRIRSLTCRHPNGWTQTISLSASTTGVIGTKWGTTTTTSCPGGVFGGARFDSYFSTVGVRPTCRD